MTSSVIALTETWLNSDSVVEGLCPTGYSIYRADRLDGRVGGGSLLLVAEHYLQMKQAPLTMPNIQAVGCSVRVGKLELCVMCVYRSPNATQEEDSRLLDWLKYQTTRFQKILILGDFNAPEVDWQTGSAPKSSFGRSLLNFLESEGMTQHINECTRFRAGVHPSILDLAITRDPNDVVDFQIAAPLGKSDHALIHLKYNAASMRPPDKWRRIYRKMDREALKARAMRMTWSMP